MSTKNRAFTLIELLVVIAIIAILAAILFPVFAQAKQAAKKAASLSNVKQLALSNVMYSGDYDDVFPHVAYDNNGWPYWTGGSGNGPIAASATLDGHALPGCNTFDSLGGCTKGFLEPNAWPNWGAETYPYVKSVDLYKSSAAKNSGAYAWNYTNAAGAGNSSYSYNGAALDVSQTQISDVAALISIQGKIDTGREALVQPTRNPSLGICNGIDINWMGNTYDHGDNYGFTDGHAKFMKRPQVTFRNFGISGVVNCYGASCVDGMKNTTGLTDTPANTNFWAAWGVCDVAGL